MKSSRRFKLLLLAGVIAPVSGLAAAARADAPDSSQLGEVVVTATRQEQTLNKVPVSVTAFTQTKLDEQGVRSIDDLTRLSPGVTLTRNGFGTQANISIRGVSSSIGTGTTGIYIDDTPIQVRSIGYSSTNTYPQLFDLQRIEVLRGPQGTLFGAGAEGGVIRFITPEPSLTTYSGYGRAEYSFTRSGSPSAEAGVAAGGPIVEDKLGFRASAWARHDGGWIDRVDWQTGNTLDKDSNSQDSEVLRLALAFAPNTNLTITPSILYQNVRLNDTYDFWDAYSNPKAGVFKQGQSLAQPDHDKFVLPALKVNYKMGGVELISSTSYFNRSNNAIDDYTNLVAGTFAGGTHIPGFPSYSSYAVMANKQNVFTEEVRLQSASADSRFSWVLGGFYSNAIQKAVEHIVDPQFEQVSELLYGVPLAVSLGQGLIGPYSLIATTESHDQQLAGFGDANLLITSKLKLTAGVRVADDTIRYTDFATGAFNGGTTADNGRSKEHPVTPKFGASYQFDEGNMAYVSVAKGYRTGGVNPTISPVRCATDFANLGITSAPTNYQSDSLWSYELGSKNRFFDNKLEIAASIYRIDWKNIQQNRYLSNCALQFTANLGGARSEGFDLQAQFRPFTGLTLNGSLGYTNARYVDPVYGPYSAALGRQRIIVNSDDHLVNRPWTGTFSAEYTFKAIHDLDSYVRGDYEYTGGSALVAAKDPMTTSFDAAAPDPQPTNDLRLRAGVRMNGWDVSVFANNVLNSEPTLTRYREGSDPIRRVTSLTPLTTGVTATFHY